MSSKNFMAYGDAETVLTGFANNINGKAKTYILNTGSTDISSTTMIPLVDINDFPDCNVGDIIVVKVNANYTFNKNAGGYWTFKINNIGYEMRMLWADESNFNQDLPKGSCVVFVYNHNMLFDDYLTVASFDVKNFDPSTVVQKSSTAGLLKNDGTVDTTTYASEAGTESLINSTVGWTGKNLLPSTAVTQSLQGVTFTVNSDKSITMNNQSTGNFAYIVFQGSVTIPSNNYRFTICRELHISSQAQVMVNDEVYYVNSDGYVDLPAGTLTRCRIDGNQYFNPDNVTYYPMVYDKRITDSTYEPYHKSVEECLTEIDTAKQPKTLATPLTIGNVSRTTVEAALGALNDVTSDLSFYLENNAVTLSTSAATTVTFSSAKITTSSCIDVGVSEWGLVPDDVTVANGTCTVTMPKVDSARTVTVRVYVK